MTTEKTAKGWRTGRTLGRTLYLDDKVVGMLDTEELARAVVERMNRAGSVPDELFLAYLRACAKEALGFDADMSSYSAQDCAVTLIARYRIRHSDAESAAQRIAELESQLAEISERDAGAASLIMNLAKELAAEREKTAKALPLLRHLRSSIDKRLAWAAPLERGITGELLAECEVAFGVTHRVNCWPSARWRSG